MKLTAAELFNPVNHDMLICLWSCGCLTLFSFFLPTSSTLLIIFTLIMFPSKCHLILILLLPFFSLQAVFAFSHIVIFYPVMVISLAKVVVAPPFFPPRNKPLAKWNWRVMLQKIKLGPSSANYLWLLFSWMWSYCRILSIFLSYHFFSTFHIFAWLWSFCPEQSEGFILGTLM